LEAIGGDAGIGALAGAGEGLAGGLIYDRAKKSEQTSYQQGYTAGQQHRPPQPPQYRIGASPGSDTVGTGAEGKPGGASPR
jgi:hypothetical protein